MFDGFRYWGCCVVVCLDLSDVGVVCIFVGVGEY